MDNDCRNLSRVPHPSADLKEAQERSKRRQNFFCASSVFFCAFLWLSQSFVSEPSAVSVLVFTKTTGFRHDSIPTGIAAIESFGFEVEATEDATVFNPQNLPRYRVVVFLNTTGDILNLSQQAAFESFIKQSGGFVGIHSASDTEYGWPFYGELIGAYFSGHPDIQTARTRVIDATHPSTQRLPLDWLRTDEWYDFGVDPSRNVNVLITVDENTYSGGNMGAHHPISWHHEYSGGRSWYTAMGHTIDSYREPLFLDHILGGILWAADAGRPAPAENDLPRRVIRRPSRRGLS